MLCISAAPLSVAQVELKLHLALTTPRKATLSGAAEIISFHLWLKKDRRIERETKQERTI